MSATILLNGVHLAVSDAEAMLLAPLVEEITSLSGRPFQLDPSPIEKPPAEHVLTPARLRMLVESRLDSLPPVRAKELALRILGALTVNNKHLTEITKR